MAFLFGKKKKAPEGTDPQAVLENITKQLENSDKCMKPLKKQVEQERAEARKCMQAKQRDKAVQYLKRAKALDAQVAKFMAISNQLTTLQQQFLDSFATREHVAMLKQANGVLPAAPKAEDVEELVDEIAQVINDALTRELGPQVDMGEVDDELAAMEGELDGGAPVGVAPGRATAAAIDEDEMAGLMAGFA
jgi:hypothetical protein